MLKLYRIYYGFLLKYKWRFVAFFGFLLSYAVAESVQPYFYKLLIDAIPTQNISLIAQILIIFFVVRITRLLLNVLTYWTGDNVLLASARDARLAVFKKIQDLDFAFHLQKSTGSMISSIKRGDMAFFSTFHILNIGVVRVIVGFLVVLVFFAQANITIALMMVAAFGLNFACSYFLINRNVNARKEFNQAEDDISSVIVDNLLNFETVKLFAKERKELNRLKIEFKPWLTRLWAYANSFRLIDLVVGGIGNLGFIVVLFYSLDLFRLGQLSGGSLVMVVGFVSDFYSKFFDLVFQLRDLAKQQTDLISYFAPLNQKTLVVDPKKPMVLENVRGEIEFENLGFSYPEGKQDALNNVNLVVKSGESVAFVGHSGAGKTTITKLLMRFYDPNVGRILLDGHDIKNFTKDHLRSFMGVVPQDPILFNNTIEYNIAYGADQYTPEQLERAVKMANLNEFIDSMPLGLKTHVGERGVKLSGGQKQRLAIARMILAEPQIIIFDEATSQLDSQSEKKIQDAFWQSAKGKTTFIVAHRLSTVIKADRIVVMDGGTIVEMGSHRELLKNENGLYSHFWRLQTMEEEK